MEIPRGRRPCVELLDAVRHGVGPIDDDIRAMLDPAHLQPTFDGIPDTVRRA